MFCMIGVLVISFSFLFFNCHLPVGFNCQLVLNVVFYPVNIHLLKDPSALWGHCTYVCCTSYIVLFFYGVKSWSKHYWGKKILHTSSQDKSVNLRGMNSSWVIICST